MNKLLFVIIAFMFLGHQAQAADWKLLHEAADKKNLQQAKSDYEANTNSLEAAYILGLVYLNEHKDKEAGEIFHQIISKDDNFLGAEWGKAEVLRREHKIEESERILNEIIKNHPEFYPVSISLAYLKFTQKKFNQSVALAVKVRDAGIEKVDLSNFTRAYLIIGGGKGMIAYYGGPLSKIINGTEVLPNLQKAERLQPDSAALYFGFGSFYLLSPSIIGGDKKKAQEYLEKAIKKDPLFADAYVRMAQLYRFQGDNAKYREYMSKALEIDSNNQLAFDIQSGKCEFVCLATDR